MNREKSNIETGNREIRACRVGAALGTLFAVALAVACSSKPKQKLNYDQPVASARPAVLKTVATTVTQPAGTNVGKQDEAEKKPLSKTINYKSRDYGVSFEFPRQYAYVSAKTVANDESRKPKKDGGDAQFTLASVEIPKGFYPDTDFERGYFTVSLNEELSQDECLGSIGPKDVKLANINGLDFDWIETDQGGSGESVKTRNYVAYTNATCYELELGVKSKNEKGMAREVDPDKVFKRLDEIVSTVKIKPTLLKQAGSVQEAAGK